MSDIPYRYWPITERPRLEWPDGKGLAVYLAVNIEHFVPGIPAATIIPPTAALPVDPANYGWRDYGVRVGIWRLIELFDSFEVRASVLLNSDVCEHYPEIVAAGVERDWAWLGHGFNNSQLWTGFEEDEERAKLTEMFATIEDATGKSPSGWLGPALSETANTPRLLAELGASYTLDWNCDDQPFPFDVEGQRFISVPYSVALNDIPAFVGTGQPAEAFSTAILDQVEVLRSELPRRSGSVLAIGLHPFLIGQPFRAKYLAMVLKAIAGMDDVWLTTSDDIAAWYMQNYYDEAMAILDRRAATKEI